MRCVYLHLNPVLEFFCFLLQLQLKDLLCNAGFPDGMFSLFFCSFFPSFFYCFPEMSYIYRVKRKEEIWFFIYHVPDLTQV